MSTLDAPTAASVEPAGPSPAPPTTGSPLCKAARDPLGAPLGKAARVSEELSIECMLAISFQRSDAGYTSANRPTPVETSYIDRWERQLERAMVGWLLGSLCSFLFSLVDPYLFGSFPPVTDSHK